ncbi:hypothetical protein L0244_21410 [bacterium]|nr:hypothetical protein [bacterium]
MPGMNTGVSAWEKNFNQVRLDTEAGTLVWPNEADCDPATLHDWDKVGETMITMARS